MAALTTISKLCIAPITAAAAAFPLPLPLLLAAASHGKREQRCELVEEEVSFLLRLADADANMGEEEAGGGGGIAAAAARPKR